MSAGSACSPLRRDDDGQALVELVIVLPVLLLVALLMIFFGRIESAQGDVEAAARAGAEAAVIQSNAALAQSSATAAVTATLASDHIACPSPTVSTNVGNFTPGGSVSVLVTCVANFADVAAPGIPGAKTFRATSTAPIDPYTVITGGFIVPVGSAGSNQRMGDTS